VRNSQSKKIGLTILTGSGLLAMAAMFVPAAALAQGANANSLIIAKPEPTAAAPAAAHPAAAHPAAAHPAAAHPAADHASVAKPAAKSSGLYFVEFRSRYAQSYGHTFLVHGRVGQKITRRDVAGLHPAGEDPGNWVVGHFVWVPSETGASDGDTEEKYVSARYRITMNKAQYDRVAAYIKKVQADSPMWHGALYNCNAFVGKIAEFMGLKVPSSTMVYPKVYVTHLRLMNSGHPQADETLMSDNMKEMNSPTRDGQAMRNAGVVPAAAERKKRSSASVTIGSVRPASGASQ
jgi:hypothetical protein